MNIDHLADAFPGLLVGMLWQTTLLFLVAWAVNRWLFKKASAQVRYWIWVLVLLRFFIPVTGWISVPTSSSDRLPIPVGAAVGGMACPYTAGNVRDINGSGFGASLFS